MKPQQSVPNDCFDRRAIPDAAHEGWWSAPDGQLIRRIDWLAGDDSTRNKITRGSLLFVPGRADFYEKYLESLDHWYRRGWKVTAIDWRGQWLSRELGDDNVAGHGDDFGAWVDDLAAFWTEWKELNPAPHVLVGHSMGGHIVLRALAMSGIKPDAGVLSAPMLGFKPDRLPRGVLYRAARLMVWLRRLRRAVWKGSEDVGRLPDDRFDMLTHDRDRYADETWWRQERPELRLGRPSWGWISAALASMKFLDRPALLEAIATPVLFAATSADGLVSYSAIERAAERLPNSQLMDLGEQARHEILREVDAVREEALRGIDQFLDEVAPVEGPADGAGA
ncbi:MAG: alpha/beta hydrolase [Sphingomonadaceae bacterium]|nr:alpha/beta hydrolase [Sphingomonadaceae bacterium]